MEKLVVLFLCTLLFVSCGSSSTDIAVTPTATPSPAPVITPTPKPSFPAIGEWLYNAPYSLTNDSFALVIDIQQANSTSNVASITSIVGECVYDHIDQNGHAVRIPTPYIYTSSASDTINGSDISLTANVYYFSSGIKTIYGMLFVGTINSDGSLSLASSQLDGVQDYSFQPTTGAVAQVKASYSSETCT